MNKQLQEHVIDSTEVNKSVAQLILNELLKLEKAGKIPTGKKEEYEKHRKNLIKQIKRCE